jgi:hypothetical protein
LARPRAELARPDPEGAGDPGWSVGADEEFSEIELEFEHAAEELGQA